MKMSKSHSVIAARMEEAWHVAWTYFFRPETSIFYDWLSSYQPGRELAHLPTSDEVKRLFPNPCGWGTGMEDGMISAGVMLAMICDRYSVTGEPELAERARQVFRGMDYCGRGHGTPGFVARSICLEDGKSVYINSSRDQYTHYIHGLWRYFHSPLSGAEERTAIRELVGAVAAFAEKWITPENDYRLARLDGELCPVTVCKMWSVAPHEAARLPMIYAAAWKICGDPHWRDMYLEYAADAAEQSTRNRSPYLAYALLQMQSSLELIIEADDEHPELRKQFLAAMKDAAELSQYCALKCAADAPNLDLTMLCPDWRSRSGGMILSYPVPQWGDYLPVLMTLRSGGEAPLTQMMVPDARLTPIQFDLLQQALLRPDYSKISNYGVFYLLAAYWKARKLQYSF